MVINAAIGILQELRAKRQLDRLALLVAPRARVVRDGETVAVPVEGVVEGDAIRLEPGEQVVADGPLLEARSLQLDESVLTGEADPVGKALGDEVRSGSFCIAGGGIYRADMVGDDAYASTLTETARAERRDLSPLQRDINRLLRLMILVMVPIAALLIAALEYHKTPVRQAVSTATAGLVTLVPEGLVLLASVAFAVGAARMARRGALVQRLSAVESLAGVDVVCVDKTGTLTDGTLALDEIVPLGRPLGGRGALRAGRVRDHARRAEPDRRRDRGGPRRGAAAASRSRCRSRRAGSGAASRWRRVRPSCSAPPTSCSDTLPTPDRSPPSSTSARGSGAASCCSPARDRRSRRSATAIPRCPRSSRSGSSR